MALGQVDGAVGAVGEQTGQRLASLAIAMALGQRQRPIGRGIQRASQRLADSSAIPAAVIPGDGQCSVGAIGHLSSQGLAALSISAALGEVDYSVCGRVQVSG